MDPVSAELVVPVCPKPVNPIYPELRTEAAFETIYPVSFSLT